jgi:hypothetical protein
MKAYTYLVKHIPSKTYYYGFRCANKVEPKQDLWNDYYTSSNQIKQLIEDTGKESFEVQVRQTFNTKEKAIKWEETVLRRMKVLHDDKWLNQNIAGYRVPTKAGRQVISETHKGKAKTAEHKEKIREALSGVAKKSDVYQSKEYRDNMSKIMSGSGNPMYGKQHTNEAKKSIGEKNKAAMLAKGDNHHMKKVEWTEERRQKMRDIRAKRTNNKPKPITCPHCKRDIPDNVYKRWHGDNCKKAKTV